MGSGTVRFRWNGRAVTARDGDTVAVALWRHGVRALGVSRTRHRPLGAGGDVVQGALVTVDGRPHVHADHLPVRDGMDVRGEGAWPAPGLDLLALARWLPRSWIGHGFERPYLLRSGTRRFQVWERWLLRLAGGVTPPTFADPVPRASRWDGDTVVVGGGPAGIAAANAAAAAGERVCLVTRSARLATTARALGVSVAAPDPRVWVRTGHEVAGIYRGGTAVVVAPRDPLQPATLLVAARLVLAHGRESLPPFVPGAHRPGVFNARTALRWAPRLGADFGAAVVVGTGEETAVAAALRRAGVAVVTEAPVGDLEAVDGRPAVTAVRLRGRRVRADLLVHAGPTVVNDAWACQAGGVSARVTTVGAAAEPGTPPPVDDRLDFSVCACFDVSAQDLRDRRAEGLGHLEELKRATSCGMGPCQGFPCWHALRACAGSAAVGLPTRRPPARALTVAQAAGLDGLLELE